MKIVKFALAFAFVLGGFKAFAEEPTFDSWGYGWMTTSGYYPIEFWLDAYDNDGDMTNLRVDAHDEYLSRWYTYYGSGNGSHLAVNEGWGCTIDGDTDGHVWITDSVDTYYHETQFYF